MTKNKKNSKSKNKPLTPERRRRQREALTRAINKHFSDKELQFLRKYSAWELADNKYLTEDSNFTNRIHQVSIRLLPNICGIRAIFESMGDGPESIQIDPAAKKALRAKLLPMVDGLKTNTALSVIEEYAVGNFHPIKVDQLILILNKIALGYSASSNDSTGLQMEKKVVANNNETR